MKNKLYNIQALRAFAVMLVVGLHLLAVEAKYSTGVLLPNFLRIGISGVDLFFIISGFIMVTVTASAHAGDLAKRGSGAWKFFYLRLSRIYPLYWLVSAIALVIFVNHPTFMNVPHYSTSFVAKSFLLLPQQGLPLLMVGWSLVHEMYFYVVFAGFLLLPRKVLPYLLLVWLGVVIAGFPHVRPFDSSQSQYLRFVFSPLTVEFIAGAYLALLVESRVVARQGFWLPKQAFCLGLLSLPVIWHFFSFNANSIDVAGWPRVYLFTGPFLLMLYGAVAMEKNQLAIAPGWLVRIGDHSYSIYLTHILVLSVCGRIWKSISWDSYADNALMIVLALASVLVCGTLCFRFIEKPLLNLSRHLVRF
jgi:peptidoglycan/LPS O-acetylase OafA/YrhL